MADQSDVANQLVTMIGALLYPNGETGSPPPSVIGAPARIYRGWPNSENLDIDLRAGMLNVSVYEGNGVERNTTRYPLEWQTTAQITPSITATVAASTVTLGGTTVPGQNVAIKVQGKAFVHTLQANESLTMVAAALASQIAVVYPGSSSSGVAVTVAGPSGSITTAVGASGTAIQEVGRQEKQFQIVLWCPTPALRDAAGSLIKPYLDGLIRFTLPDASVAHIHWMRGTINDAPEKELLFRRDLFYLVEFATTQSQTVEQIVAFETKLEDVAGNVLADRFA